MSHLTYSAGYSPYKNKYRTMDRDTKAVSANELALFSVKEKGNMSLSGGHIREIRKNVIQGQPLSPSIVRITNVPIPNPTPEQQQDALDDANAEYAQSRPSTPQPQAGSSPSSAPPATPRKTKKAYEGLGHGTPPRSAARNLEKERQTLFILNPSPSRSSSGSRPSSSRSASRKISSPFSGTPVDGSGVDPLLLVDYPHFRNSVGRLTITSAETSLLHFVPQVFDDPDHTVRSRERSMIDFTLDAGGIPLFEDGGVLKKPLVIFPGNLYRENPRFIRVQLFYPGFTSHRKEYVFERTDRETGKPTVHRERLFKIAQQLVLDVVSEAVVQKVVLPPGLTCWDPLQLYQEGRFRVIGLKHYYDDTYIVALGVSSLRLPRV